MKTTPSLTARRSESEEQHDSPPDLTKRRLLLPLSQQTQAVDNVVATDEVSEPQAPFLAVAEYIRRRSAAGELTNEEDFQQVPYALDKETASRLFEQIGASEACADILSVSNDKERYYYSDRSISHNYARILIFTHEQDICKTIADTVRFECQTYPRPYKVQMLRLPPYSFDRQKIDEALLFFQRSAEFQDIRPIAASNGEPYLFSERFMSYGKAKGLCEWIEVEQFDNP